jgi:hypothetical protein
LQRLSAKNNATSSADAAASLWSGAASRTSHRSSPVADGSSVNSRYRLSIGPQRYSSRNSATSHHRVERLAA